MLSKFSDHIIQNLVPVYHMDNSLLVCLDVDYNYDKAPIDGLVIDLSLDRQSWRPPRGTQMVMKWDGGFWLTVEQNKRNYWLERILSTYTNDQIAEMVSLLNDPPEESLRSLIWIPPRLRYRIDINDINLKHKTDDSRF